MMCAPAAPNAISREDVIQHSRSLPSFPAVVTEIMATLDDPDGNFSVLVRAINRDPLISARVLAVANTAAMRSSRGATVCDITTATSLIGMDRVRHITLISSLNTFVAGAVRSGLPRSFWQHSVAVGICCEELALHIDVPVAPAKALITGLLHDIGQLWLHHTSPVIATSCRQTAHQRGVATDQIEREQFGIDHCTIGAWLAEHWALPADVVAAIRGHHQPEQALDTTLVALVHVAEVLSNALDLTGRAENRVTSLNSAACEKLGLVWCDNMHMLFGSIEARSRHANAFFDAPTPKISP